MQNTDRRAEIEARLEAVYCLTQKDSQRLNDRISLEAFRALVRKDGEKEIWTDALQAAVNAHEIVIIPARTEPYYIDSTVVLPSDRRIEAAGATVRLTKECDVVMFLSHSAADGTHAPSTVKKRPVPTIFPFSVDALRKRIPNVPVMVEAAKAIRNGKCMA